MKLLITDIFGCAKVRNNVIFSNGYDVMNNFAKFEKFLSHSTIIPSFIIVRSQMPELDGEAKSSPPPPNLNIFFLISCKVLLTTEALCATYLTREFGGALEQ